PACVIIPAGSFPMGCETGRDEEQPVHDVWTDAFELAVLQVTVRDYGIFLADTDGQPPLHWGDAGFSHPDQPVVAVGWFVAAADWLQKDDYAQSPARNPRGPETGERRASRGGSWRHHIKVSRCAARSSIPPLFQYADYGFRVARELRQESGQPR